MAKVLEVNELKEISISHELHEVEVKGKYGDREFHIKLHMEVDGRDVESELLSGDYDPMADEEDLDFFDVLCQDDKFEALTAAAYNTLQAD